MNSFKTISKLSVLALASLFLLTGCDVPVLQPKGPVGRQEYHLILWSFGLMAVVVLAVFIIFAVVIIKYRGNRADLSNYDPENHGSAKLEVLWTIIPIVIVVLMAVPTVKSEYNLQKSPSPNVKPLVVDVTSAQWKWIFRYPEEGISTVNQLYIPENRPIRFVLTSEGAMNSFWVPSLGGQIYTMTGMKTHMYLEADSLGTFQGRAANFNGREFAHQTFTVTSVKPSDFDTWVQNVKQNKTAMTMADYKKLIQPGLVGKQAYSSYPKQLDQTKSMPGMSMSDSTNTDSNQQSDAKSSDSSGMSMKGGN